jgi:signal transduction histidine kinase
MLRLKQVIINLLSNAVKFNHEEGKIKVFCTVSTSSSWLRISVQDSGCGLGQEDLKRVFEPFNRFDADEKAIEGTGIGLTLTKQFVELMHGKIGVDSALGKGSTFWVEFPISG